jgi:hypothetical protein
MTMTTALAPGVGVEVTPSTGPGAPAGSDGPPGQLRVGRRRHRAASPRSVLRARPRERCQFENSFYVRDWPYNLARGARHAVLLFLRHAERPVAQGRPSSYQVGDWVRVKDAGAVRATLDSRDCLRGLRFTAVQSAYCGRTYPGGAGPAPHPGRLRPAKEHLGDRSPGRHRLRRARRLDGVRVVLLAVFPRQVARALVGRPC